MHLSSTKKVCQCLHGGHQALQRFWSSQRGHLCTPTCPRLTSECKHRDGTATFQARFERDKKWVNISEGKPGSILAPISQLVVNVWWECHWHNHASKFSWSVIGWTACIGHVRESNVPCLRTANNDFRMLVESQGLEQCRALTESLDFVFAELPYNIRAVQDSKNFTTASWLLLTWRPCRSFAVRC